jgi:hypothetical protein
MPPIEDEKRCALLEALRQHLANGVLPCAPVRPDPFSESEKEDPVLVELGRLYDWLLGGAEEEWTPTTAIGRLRHLYRYSSEQVKFSETLITVLCQIVESFPFLATAPEMVIISEGCYQRVGGPDTRTPIGYEPQHRSRFLSLFH